MYTFQFSPAVWFGLCLDFKSRWADGQQSSYAQATDTTGRRIVFVHAGPDGLLGESPDLIRSLKPDAVVCCHPRLAKRLYPDLPILGNWLAKTHTHGGKSCVLYIEEDCRETVPESTAS